MANRKFKKCPRCELNYILVEEELCDVCKAELKKGPQLIFAIDDMDDEIESWESKYEDLSEQVCINCGKSAKYMTPGWISFICEDCIKEYQGRAIPIEDISAFYKDPEAY